MRRLLALSLLFAHPAFAETLTLDQVVQQAVNAHPAAREASARSKAAEATAKTRGKAAEPTLSGAATLAPAIEVGLDQALPWLGKLAAERASGTARAASAKAAGRGTTNTVARAAKLAAVDLWEVDALAEANRTLTAAAEQALKTATDLGLPAGEVLRAKLEVERLTQAAESLASRREALDAALDGALGGAPAPASSAPTATGSAARTIALPSPVKLPKVCTLSHEVTPDHPLLAERAALIEAAEAERDAVSYDGLPTLSVGLRYLDTDSDATVGERIGLGATISLPAWGDYDAKEEAADAAILAARAQADDARRTLEVAIKRAYEAAARAEREFELRDKQLIPLATEALDETLKRFAAGSARGTDVAEAQRTLTTLLTERAQARADHERAVADLEQALGRSIRGTDAQSTAR